MAPRVGDPAPDIVLPSTDGGSVSLGGTEGERLVLYFYPKDGTPSCTREAIDFDALAEDFARAGTRVVGISPDGLKRHEKFKAKHGLGLVLAADEERRAIDAYGLWVEKSLYGLRYMGVERTTVLIGPDRRIARIWSKVRVKGHAAEVLEAARTI